MKIMIEIEDPNEVQMDLISMIQIQDKIKENKRDQEETKKINETISQISQKLAMGEFPGGD
jgi:hypothetical protein